MLLYTKKSGRKCQNTGQKQNLVASFSDSCEVFLLHVMWIELQACFSLLQKGMTVAAHTKAHPWDAE